MAKRLIWTEFAQAQKKEIFAYWNNRNGSKTYSRKLSRLFDEAAELLTTQPYIGRPTQFENIRIKKVKTFHLIYKITNNEIQILIIWNTRRNPDDLTKLMEDML